MLAVIIYILVAVKVLGFGSCWVVSYKKEYLEDVKKLLNVLDNLEFCVFIVIGYVDEEFVRNKKLLFLIFYWDKY